MKIIMMIIGALCIFLPLKLWAVPAYPGSITVAQPDGSPLEIRLYGDEYYHLAKTPDHYTLLRNKRGGYEYAVTGKNGDLVPSGVAARNRPERTSAEKRLLPTLKKNLTFSSSQSGVLRQA